MKPFVVTHIVAATDLSESSLPALRYARLYADRFAAKLTVAYTDPLVYPFDYMTPIEGFHLDPTPEHAAHLRDEVSRHAEPVMRGREWDVDVTVGQPIPGILAAAARKHADLIVIGTHLRRGWRRALLGSISDGVLHGSRCPVLTVADRDEVLRAGVHVTNVVCPVNFTDVARESLHVAARIAEAFGASLTVIHVLETDDITNIGADAEKMRDWVAPELQDRVACRDLVVRGGAAECVLDSADGIGADLLVVGAQHKRFRNATVIGTTAERLIRFASCPVLVVPREPVHKAARRADEWELAVTAGV
jgi:nucleotide-binding universal stress UspA family protein